MDMEVFSCRKNAFFPGAHKIGAAISGPRIADKKHFTDTRNKVVSKNHPDAKGVRQKEFGKKVTKKVTEASEKVTEK